MSVIALAASDVPANRDPIPCKSFAIAWELGMQGKVSRGALFSCIPDSIGREGTQRAQKKQNLFFCDLCDLLRPNFTP